jgi:hypothetical protein
MTKHEATIDLSVRLLDELRTKLCNRMYTDENGMTTDIVQINLFPEVTIINDLEALISSLS